MTTIDSVIANQTANAATYGADAVTALNQALTNANSVGFSFPQSTISWSATNGLQNDPGFLSGVGAQFLSEYEAIKVEMTSLVNSQLNLWEQTYMPAYMVGMNALEGMIQSGFTNGTALPANYDSALFNKARSNAETAYNRNAYDAEQRYKKRGFDIFPDMLAAELSGIAIAASDAIAQQATDIYIKRSEQEIQHIQLCMAQSNQLRQVMITNFVQYASMVASVNRDAMEFGKMYAEFSRLTYLGLIERMKAEIEIDRLKFEQADSQAKLNQDRNEKAIDFTMAMMTLSANITKDVGALYAQMSAAALVAQGTMVTQASTL